jgi:hypothetical protein
VPRSLSRLSLNICYESSFSSETRRVFTTPVELIWQVCYLSVPK